MRDDKQIVESMERLLTSIGKWLKITHRECIDEYKDLDLTEHQYKVLCVLKKGGPYKMMELGDILHTSSGSLTVMIDRLVAKHMVERFFMQEDRRVVMVGITDVGLSALEQFRTGLLERLRQRLEKYDDKKLQRIADAAEELLEVFEEDI